jgi:hypothetical protein
VYGQRLLITAPQAGSVGGSRWNIVDGSDQHQDNGRCHRLHDKCYCHRRGNRDSRQNDQRDANANRPTAHEQRQRRSDLAPGKPVSRNLRQKYIEQNRADATDQASDEKNRIVVPSARRKGRRKFEKFLREVAEDEDEDVESK